MRAVCAANVPRAACWGLCELLARVAESRCAESASCIAICEPGAAAAVCWKRFTMNTPKREGEQAHERMRHDMWTIALCKPSVRPVGAFGAGGVKRSRYSQELGRRGA